MDGRNPPNRRAATRYRRNRAPNPFAPRQGRQEARPWTLRSMNTETVRVKGSDPFFRATTGFRNTGHRMISPRFKLVAKINALPARRGTFFVRTKKVPKENRPVAFSLKWNRDIQGNSSRPWRDVITPCRPLSGHPVRPFARLRLSTGQTVLAHPALLAVSGGRSTARPCADDRRARSLARPFGLFPQTVAMLGAARGILTIADHGPAL